MKTWFFQKNGRKKLAVIKTGFLTLFSWTSAAFFLHCLSTMSDLLCSQCNTPYESSDRFCEFCGQPFYRVEQANSAETPQQPLKQTIMLVLQNGKRFKLDQTQWVGRSDPANGWLPKIDLAGFGGVDGGVSRRHARIIMEAGQLFIEDVGSSNGTILNGVHLTIGQRFPIQSGDKLLFGRVYARVSNND